MDHYEEANQNCFCQFVHDGATLLNKDKYQAFGMQFTDNQFRHNNETSLCFRKPLTHEADMVAQLVQDISNEMFETNFQNIFSCSVQDLAASAVAKELLVDKVECDMHQGDKVGASVFGDLTRSLNEGNLLIFYVFFYNN